jgi:chromosome segregation ATPase
VASYSSVDEKELEKHRGEINDILESQAMLDEIIVKSSDDILVMQKTKEENSVAIQMLDAKLDKINEVLQMTKKEIKDKEEKKEWKNTQQ